MLYTDPVYGSVEITEPVLLDLINAHAVKRLHGVLQHGVTALVGVTRETTRFEHSMGVMILVRALGGSLSEQIAALLHDVSHTAFSHVIDYVFGGYDTQGYHEEHKIAYISGTDIPSVLNKYSLNWMDFAVEEDFSLLEQDLPKLCADRLDYFLRDARDLGLATDDEVSECLSSLKNFNGRIVVNNLHAARWLGYTFIQADQDSWANFREVGLYELAARAIRRGLEIGVITDKDLWGMDRPVWAKLNQSSDINLQQNLQLVNADTRFVWDERNPDFRISTKLRSIDPDVLTDSDIISLSDLDHEFAQHRNNYLADKSGYWPMRVADRC